MTPLISVVINTYNHEFFIEDAICSALAQDYPRSRFEILVVDDGSTDRTPEIVRAFGPRVRLLRKENGDQCSAVPYGAAHANGEVVAILDGDDVWLPNKLSRVAQEFARDSRTVMVYHRYIFWDCRDNTVWEPNDPSDVSGDILADRRKLLTYWAPPMSSLTFRRDAFQRLTNIPPGRAFTYDLFLASAILFVGPVAYVPQVLTKNRVHGSNRWVAGQNGPTPATLKRRIARRGEAINILRGWIWANAPKSLRPPARILLRSHRLAQIADESLLNPPGRLRIFKNEARQILTYGAVMTPAHRSYRWARAFGVLVVGSHVHYLEGVRTRVNKLRRRWQAPSAETEPHGKTAGNVR